ncbi:hypothetical protein [Fontibacillus panacisegetis]|uniref:hypothetical protein n=1 Tax=Fontibacillus panacisegetis TaxID=670482 RepID=UPI001113D270|nr:hypothetical protein [Fontibacillus panacisegetis]
MISRKYKVLLLFLLLSCIYTIFIDICVGLPWNTFMINWKYTLFTQIERFIAVFMVLLLVIPDLIRYLRRKQEHTTSSTSSSSPDTNSNINANPDSGFNPKSGPSS